MGLDVFATYCNEDCGPLGSLIDVDADEHARQVFHEAYKRAMATVGADMMLESGSLGMTTSVEHLVKATQENDRHAQLNAEEVKQKFALAKWPNLSELGEAERIATVSAKEFLRTCAENGYGILYIP